jgi:hypothetical protein
MSQKRSGDEQQQSDGVSVTFQLTDGIKIYQRNEEINSKNIKRKSLSYSTIENVFIVIHFFGFYFEDNLCGSMRLFIAFMIGACTFILFAQRQSLNMTLLCMVDQQSIEESLSSSQIKMNNTCTISTFNTSNQITVEPGSFSWDKSTQGLLVGAFYWGYW